jgi:WD40 repeat protein
MLHRLLVVNSLRIPWDPRAQEEQARLAEEERPNLPSPLPLGMLLSTYQGHCSGVVPVVWSPDGRRIASSSHDRTAQVWDATDGGHVYTYRGHADQVWSVA